MRNFASKKTLETVLVATLSLLLSSSASATNITIGGILAGGALMHKPIQSLKELRYKNMVKQTTDYSCGAAALATLLNYGYGKNLSEKEVLLELAKTNIALKTKGISLKAMQHYVYQQGLQAQGLKAPVAALEKLKIPAIMLLNFNGYRHFVVFKKMKGNKIYIADPALGNKVLTREELKKSWNNILMVVLGEGYNKQTALIKPIEKLSAKKFIRPHTVQTHIPKLEFGFGHAKYF